MIGVLSPNHAWRKGEGMERYSPKIDMLDHNAFIGMRPVTDGEWVKYADAQATIAALQQQLAAAQGDAIELKSQRDTMQDNINLALKKLQALESQLATVTAERAIYKEAVDYYAKTAISARAVAALEKAATLDAGKEGQGE